MYNEDVSTPTDFPVEESKRWSTDICCTYISGIFALVLFILACVFFNSSKSQIIKVISILHIFLDQSMANNATLNSFSLQTREILQ
jgi:hypothetical protein